MWLGYLYLFLVIFSGLTKGFCGKKTSAYTSEFTSASFANSIRMVLCAIISFIAILIFENVSSLNLSLNGFLVSVLSGILTSIFVVTWLISVKNSAYMLIDVFLTLFTLIPIIFSLFLYNESVHFIQIIGFVILIIATLIMASYNNSIKKRKLDFKSILLLSICGLSNGLNLFCQKYFAKLDGYQSVYAFNFYTYVFSAIILTAFFVINYLRFKKRNNTLQENFSPIKTLKKIYLYILIMALCLYLNSFFSTLASANLSASLQYPLQQGLNLTLSLIMSAIFFKEKITFKSIIGITLTFISLIFINLLPSLI